MSLCFAESCLRHRHWQLERALGVSNRLAVSPCCRQWHVRRSSRPVDVAAGGTEVGSGLQALEVSAVGCRQRQDEGAATSDTTVAGSEGNIGLQTGVGSRRLFPETQHLHMSVRCRHSCRIWAAGNDRIEGLSLGTRQLLALRVAIEELAGAEALAKLVLIIHTSDEQEAALLQELKLHKLHG